MARLTDEIQAFIVQHLAMYDTPTEVVVAVKDQFGVDVSRQQVDFYDATRNGKKPAQKWVKLFEATRDRFKDMIDDIPVAQRAVRLRRLNRMAVAAEQSRNYMLAAALLKQAAEDMGGAYTNTRRLTGENGGPIKQDVTHSGSIAVGMYLPENGRDTTPAEDASQR